MIACCVPLSVVSQLAATNHTASPPFEWGCLFERQSVSLERAGFRLVLRSQTPEIVPAML